ncbi:MAG TPA: methionine--tRNA ligase [Myxococcota bacterium]|nr:methionine--tRNA ligase [Myxococcota bacterium]
MPRQILTTAALPYVNGHIHLGHLVEYIYADIWVRFQRLRGHEIRFFCADDTHGTATMIRARQENREPEQLLAEMSAAHQRDLAAFGVSFDHYGSTHAPSNQRLVNEIWAKLRAGGYVETRDVVQLYDPQAGVFLADRFVKGTCPVCKSPDQYGDNCEVCASVYSPEDLIDPVSTLTGARPERRSAPHSFVRLEDFRPFLTEWTQAPGRLPQETANWLAGAFLHEPLRDWDVSRPAPYFGFEIPDAPGHFFYVWVDAPVGYMSATFDWCQQTGEDYARWWRNDACEIHHFIGKDIVYFHALFWPVMLKVSGYPLPKQIHVHGFLTVNGEKMSKRKGTFVLARTWLEHLSPEPLRYYFASKLGGTVSDLDLALDEYVAKVNSELVGKLVNLASRTARFVEGEALVDPRGDDGGLFAAGAAAADEIAAAYEAGETGKVTRLVMALADRANEYVEARAPWTLKKDPAKREELVRVCSASLNVFHQLALYLAPILPRIAGEARALLGAPASFAFSDATIPVVGTRVAKFQHLLQRVDPAKVSAMVEASAASEA